MDKIIINIASYKRKETLLKTINSIYNQADIINISLNSYSEIPNELIDDKINIFLTNNEKGDAYKFMNLKNSDGYYLTIDDDLIYPPNYSQYLINKIEFYKRKSIITLHGRNFNSFPINNYYGITEVLHFKKELLTDKVVQFGGTGVMGFHTELLKIDLEYFEYPNMADIWIGKYAKKNNIPIVCVEHTTNYVVQQEFENSIYNNDIKNDSLQTMIVNEIFSKKEISIIIPTYKNINFIDDCLNSTLKACFNLNCEIYVGIDNCEETLEYVKSKKFDYKIKFYFFKKNYGTYIVKNSLSKIVDSDIILFFDSDDIMKENMISEILEKMKTNEFIKPMYCNFNKTPNYSITKTNNYGEGVFAIKRELFLSMNGFEPWPIAADSDFMGRLYKNKIKFDYTNSVVFYRRVHPNSLTQSDETGMKSSLRGKYQLISKNKTNFNPLPELITGNFYEVFTKKEYVSNITIPTIELSQPKDLTPILKNKNTIDYDKINEILGKKNPEKPKPQPRIQNPPTNRNEINQNKGRVQLAKESIKRR